MSHSFVRAVNGLGMRPLHADTTQCPEHPFLIMRVPSLSACAAQALSGIAWPQTPAGSSASPYSCPDNGVTVTRQCNSTGGWLSPAPTQACRESLFTALRVVFSSLSKCPRGRFGWLERLATPVFRTFCCFYCFYSSR